MDKAIVTCAVTGVLTNPDKYPVPVTPEEMAASAKEAYDAGASVMHIHFRNQKEGMGFLPTWEPDVAADISDAIRDACPGVLLNFSTGVMGDDISGPVECLRRCKPEVAAMNSGSLNYLKVRRNGEWAWPPMLFGNPVSKIEQFLKVMYELGITPECECFDTGIVRSIGMFQKAGLLRDPLHVSLVMGVASGMPAKASWLPLLLDEIPEGAKWQSIVIGRETVWAVHRRTAELGGHLRTGLEDTFYLPNGERASGNGQLIESLVNIARECGREIASPDEARAAFAAQG
ncbi:MAG: 3-keto-5-aminohexanoate cleavage protein [Myxococcales bacterium]|nr:3-keto-5-aminohexanoate cleavage protein [Myxococcales bacterium]|tara:strand:- start:1358 stop:2221 length:864 start_codon:yes stop_codon:yes gene_type:complete